MLLSGRRDLEQRWEELVCVDETEGKDSQIQVGNAEATMQAREAWWAQRNCQNTFKTGEIDLPASYNNFDGTVFLVGRQTELPGEKKLSKSVRLGNGSQLLHLWNTVCPGIQ